MVSMFTMTPLCNKGELYLAEYMREKRILRSGNWDAPVNLYLAFTIIHQPSPSVSFE